MDAIAPRELAEVRDDGRKYEGGIMQNGCLDRGMLTTF